MTDWQPIETAPRDETGMTDKIDWSKPTQTPNRVYKIFNMCIDLSCVIAIESPRSEPGEYNSTDYTITVHSGFHGKVLDAVHEGTGPLLELYEHIEGKTHEEREKDRADNRSAIREDKEFVNEEYLKLMDAWSNYLNA